MQGGRRVERDPENHIKQRLRGCGEEQGGKARCEVMEWVPRDGGRLQDDGDTGQFVKTLKVVELAESSSGSRDLPLMVKQGEGEDV